MDHDLFFRLMSEFIDEEMDFDLMDEFDDILDDEFCHDFFCTFRKTIELCEEITIEEVPPTLHIILMETIERTSQKPVRRAPARRKRLPEP